MILAVTHADHVWRRDGLVFLIVQLHPRLPGPAVCVQRGAVPGRLLGIPAARLQALHGRHSPARCGQQRVCVQAVSKPMFARPLPDWNLHIDKAHVVCRLPQQHLFVYEWHDMQAVHLVVFGGNIHDWYMHCHHGAHLPGLPIRHVPNHERHPDGVPAVPRQHVPRGWIPGVWRIRAARLRGVRGGIVPGGGQPDRVRAVHEPV